MMNFSVEFYETVAGRCPVREFLDELKASDPVDFATVLAAFAKLQNRRYHAEPLSKALGNGLFELRHVGKLNTRVLYHPTRAARAGTPVGSLWRDAALLRFMRYATRDNSFRRATYRQRASEWLTGKRE